MGKAYASIEPAHRDWIVRQHMFFVSSAPSGAGGHLNCSPKGMDSFRVLGPNRVAYLDLTGSGAETIAHVRQNGRILFMFCAFDGPPKIVRLYGQGQVVLPGDDGWAELRGHFGEHVGVRSIIVAEISRVGDSCGYSVPLYSFERDRDVLTRWAEKRGEDGVATYQAERNAQSIDGLPALAGLLPEA